MHFDIRHNQYFNIEDVSKSINDVVQNMSEGDTACLEYGNYKIKNTIYLTNESSLKNCSIKLLGNYSVENHALAETVKIEAEHLELVLGDITSNDRSDYYHLDENDVLPGGISIAETESSEFTFGLIEGFEFGIRLHPDKDFTGICFNKFTFRNITYCYAPILFSMEDDMMCWVNENKFYGGTIKGYFGVVFKKGLSQIDEYNNNTFYNMAFEAIETDAILADFCAYNTFFASRFEFVNNSTIRESDSCRCNKYITSVNIPLCSINLQSRDTVIQGPIHDKKWKNKIKGMYTDYNSQIHYDFYDRSVQTADNISINLECDVGFVDVSSSTAPVELILSDISFFSGNSIMINVIDYDKPITIKDKTSNVIVPKEVIKKGVYKAYCYDKKWRIVKLSENAAYMQF